MTITINPVGFTINEKQTDLVNTKLKKIAYADSLIVDLMLNIKHEKEFSFETNINFKWGVQAHVAATDEDFTACLNKMMDVLENKVKKEKDKHQEKK